MNKKNAFTVVLPLLEKMVSEMENNVIFVMLVKGVLRVVRNQIQLRKQLINRNAFAKKHSSGLTIHLRILHL
jgi:hypothetical protein